ncbi:hypothetical protein [Streptomyces sp. NPDC006997]|uniref:hypothetical protein n=1 Tax=Streptomyces sp. NPDC006997 TaxID=3155356 RepID=UPI0033F78125
MSSSPETSTRTTGARSAAHRAHREERDRAAARTEERDRAAARTLAQRSPARYEPYLDGLFTYCLSVLCDHDAATAALGDVLVLAERRGQRAPGAAGDRRAWLYALARWSCLRKLAEAKQHRQTHHAAGRPATARRGSARPAAAPVPEEERQRRRRELARLAWPEAAGTTPEQREALELAVRHHLAAHEVAAVLGLDLAAARDLLASAACEVERTRAALAVVETGSCPGVARLTGDGQLVLSSAVRKELVRHVDDCPRCRRTAQRAVPGRWPGATVTPAELPVLEAPRAAVRLAMAHHPRVRGGTPRFDRRGFPMDPKDRAARRDRMRARAVTTTVVATVVAAPVIALWSAYRGTPVAGEAEDGRATAASREDDSADGAVDGEDYGYENTGNATTPGPRAGDGHAPDVSVEVLGVMGAGRQDTGRLDVRADSIGDTTLITLTASGPAPVHWSVTPQAPWLYPSRSSGTLRPGETFTIKVYVDHLREPSGHWSARVAIAPTGAVVAIRGYGTAPVPGEHPSDPGTAPRPDPRPTAPGSDPVTRPPASPPPDPSPPPTTPPTTPSDPAPTDPPPTSQDPGPTTDPEPPPSDPPPSDPPPSTSGDQSPPTT